MQRTLGGFCLIAASVLAACGPGTPSAAADTAAAAPPAAAAVDAAAPGDLASSRTFNSLLGDFEFAVPDAWEQRYTATERARAPEYPGAKSVSEFMFLPLSGGTPPVLLTLIQYSASDWKTISASGKAPGTLVAEAGGRVFVASLLSANPFPAGSEDAIALAPMLLNAEQVRQALKTE
jgi:hypothetical protein